MRLRLEDLAKPIADALVFDPNSIESVEDLPVDLRFGDARPGMFLDVVVRVLLFAGLGLFGAKGRKA